MNQLLQGPQPFREVMKVAAGDPLLRNEPLRELVVLKGLMELFYSNKALQERVIVAVKEAETGCKTPENQQVAKNLSKLITHLRPGTPAPGFELPDRNGKPVSLAGMKGKPVLLCFWTTYCQGCLSEMERMALLWNKYKDRVEFVNISADRDFVMMKFFIDKKPAYGWKFLHIGDQWQVQKEYDVRSYPLFILVDKQGTLFRKVPAPAPSAGLETWLDELIAQ